MDLVFLKAQKKEVEYWINQFNGLRKTITIDKWKFGNHVDYMDIYIYKGKKFYSSGFWILEFSKKK